MEKEEFKKRYQDLRQKERDTQQVMSSIYGEKEKLRVDYFKEHSDWFDKKYVKVEWSNHTDYHEIISSEITDTNASFTTRRFSIVNREDGHKEYLYQSEHGVDFFIRVDDTGEPTFIMREGWPWNKSKEKPVVTFPSEEEFDDIKEVFCENIRE